MYNQGRCMIHEPGPSCINDEAGRAGANMPVSGRGLLLL